MYTAAGTLPASHATACHSVQLKAAASAEPLAPPVLSALTLTKPGVVAYGCLDIQSDPQSMMQDASSIGHVKSGMHTTGNVVGFSLYLIVSSVLLLLMGHRRIRVTGMAGGGGDVSAAPHELPFSHCSVQAQAVQLPGPAFALCRAGNCIQI